jgi:hypothetical protein
MLRIMLECNYDAALEQLIIAECGEHNILIYSNESTFRDIYSNFCKAMFENNRGNNSNNNSGIDDEIVILIPSYETVNDVEFTLDKRTGINPEKYEKEGSLFLLWIHLRLILIMNQANMSIILFYYSHQF